MIRGALLAAALCTGACTGPVYSRVPTGPSLPAYAFPCYPRASAANADDATVRPFSHLTRALPAHPGWCVEARKGGK